MPLYLGSTKIPALSVLNPLTEIKQCDHVSVEQATPSISISNSGLITAQVTQSEGLVSSGTKSVRMQLAVQEGKTVTPSTSEQTAVYSGKYTTGNVVVAGDKNLKAENIADGVSIFGVVGTHSGGSSGGNIEQVFIDLVERDIKTASLPNGITKIGNHAFYQYSSLALTSLPEGISSIGQQAFYGCTSLALTSLPEGLTTLGNGAFNGCTSLALTSLPEGLTNIGSSAFTGCTSLALTSLPEGLTTLGTSVFSKCTSLALTSLPEGLTKIALQAFYNCTSLTSITFKRTPSSVDSSAFSGCTNLTTINVPWAEGAVANAPWGATNATINYNYAG